MHRQVRLPVKIYFSALAFYSASRVYIFGSSLETTNILKINNFDAWLPQKFWMLPFAIVCFLCIAFILSKDVERKTAFATMGNGLFMISQGIYSAGYFTSWVVSSNFSSFIGWTTTLFVTACSAAMLSAKLTEIPSSDVDTMISFVKEIQTEDKDDLTTG